MQSNIISGIVRINRPDGKTAGTGFVVSDRLIATCAHVIPPGAEPIPGKPPEKVELVFRKSNEKRSAHVVAEWWRPADAPTPPTPHHHCPLAAAVPRCAGRRSDSAAPAAWTATVVIQRDGAARHRTRRSRSRSSARTRPPGCCARGTRSAGPPGDAGSSGIRAVRGGCRG